MRGGGGSNDHGPEILRRCGGKRVVLGLLDPGTHEVERPEHVAARLRAALEVARSRGAYTRLRAAWRFVCFATGPEAQGIMARSTGYVLVNTLALERPAPHYAEHPMNGAAAKNLGVLTDRYGSATPAPVMERLNAAFNDALRDPAVAAKLREAGITIEGGPRGASARTCGRRPGAGAR